MASIPSADYSSEIDPAKKVGLIIDEVVEAILSSDLLEIKKIEEGRGDEVHPVNTEKIIKQQRINYEEAVEGVSFGIEEVKRQLVRLREVWQKPVQEDKTESNDGVQAIMEEAEAGLETILRSKKREGEVFADQQKELRELIGKTLVDEKTGIASGDGLIESMEVIVNEALEKNELGKLKNVELLLIDMMLFHKGNEMLGTIGFDDRVAFLMRGLKGVARYLSSPGDLYEPYPAESNGKEDAYFEKYFPEGSEVREELDKLKTMAVKISPARINPGGGDEFAMLFEYQDEAVEARRLALKTVNHVIKSTVISKERVTVDEQRVVEPEERDRRREIYHGFVNCFNSLAIPTNEKAGVPGSEAQKYYAFLNALRGVFLGRDDLFEQFCNPAVDLRMDYAYAANPKGELPQLYDVITRLVDDSLIGEENSVIRKGFVDHLRRSLVKRLSGEELQDLSLIETEVRQLFTREVLKTFVEKYNDAVNIFGKAQKKQSVYFEAATEKSVQAMYTIGEVEMMGREFGSLSDAQKKVLLDRLIEYYERRFLDEKNKETEAKGQYVSRVVKSLAGYFEKNGFVDRRKQSREAGI